MPKYSLERLDQFPTLTPQLLRLAYREMCIARCYVGRVVQECSKGAIKFSIWGPGEELHGAAEALAFNEVVNKEAFGMLGHYRSAGLLSTWARLQGHEDFHLDHFRQQYSKVTDPWSGGRQMTSHYNQPSLNMLPVQSAVGMQMGKGAGYAFGLKRKYRDGLCVAIVGDGTMAESDFHEGMHAAVVLEVPFLVMVTDNNVAISVKPEDGRGIRDLAAYAKAFDCAFYEVDGNDFLACYETTKAAAAYCVEHQRPALFWVHGLSRLNGHSNAGDYGFAFDQHDCINDFGEALVERGILEASDIVHRNGVQTGRDYFRRHDLGRFGTESLEYIDAAMGQAKSEPEPTYASTSDHLRPPFPVVDEAAPQGRPTVVSLNGAIRAALRDILESNPMTWLYGQDVAEMGGVMQATVGLWKRFPDQVRDAPINEPLILGTAVGFALHEGSTALPEIQFSDYSLNALHWLVHLGNAMWTSNGSVKLNVIIRLPVEPLPGGAVYHSMCMEGFYGSIPGLTIIAPSTARDCYGLLRSAAEYEGPVLVLESKGLYRKLLGDAFPGEPTDPEASSRLQRAIGFEGFIPDLPRDLRVPLGKATIRRSGRDLSIVTWGRCTITCAKTVEALSEAGIDCEIIDLRTVVPFDMEAILESVRRTGRLLVVHEDRVFASVGREIQGAVIEATRGEQVVTRVLGQDAVPGIPQNVKLERALVVTPEKILAAAREVLAASSAPAGTSMGTTCGGPHVLWTPNRNFVS
ncbi:MAG: thiamine pyrophosphate-dependent enzyme [Nannocystaceae bacterium]